MNARLRLVSGGRAAKPLPAKSVRDLCLQDVLTGSDDSKPAFYRTANFNTYTMSKVDTKPTYGDVAKMVRALGYYSPATYELFTPTSPHGQWHITGIAHAPHPLRTADSVVTSYDKKFVGRRVHSLMFSLVVVSVCLSIAMFAAVGVVKVPILFLLSIAFPALGVVGANYIRLFRE